MVHDRGHPQIAVAGAMHEHRAATARGMFLAVQWRLQRGRYPRVSARGRELLVRHQLGLDHYPRLSVDRLHVIADGGYSALGEGDQPRRRDPHAPAGRGDPFHLASQDASPEVEYPLMRAKLAIADVEGLIVHEQPEQLAVGDVDHRLTGLREPVADLRIGQWAALIETVQVGAWKAVRVTLVEIPAPADMPVGQREQ